jgi:hypothetical protein
LIDLKSGLIETTHRATIRFPPYLRKAARPQRLVVGPALVTGGVLAAGLLVAFVVVIRRRRRAGSAGDQTASV